MSDRADDDKADFVEVERLLNEARRAMEQIESGKTSFQDNLKLLVSCKRHRIIGFLMRGGQVECAECGGKLWYSEAIQYLLGYESAGGDGEDVWPGFRAKRDAL